MSPKPWYIGTPSPDINAQVTIRDVQGWDVAHCFGESATENARVIIMAPELLAALQELVARCDGEEGIRADGSNIQTMWASAVIAAALGE